MNTTIDSAVLTELSKQLFPGDDFLQAELEENICEGNVMFNRKSNTLFFLNDDDYWNFAETQELKMGYWNADLRCWIVRLGGLKCKQSALC